MRPAHTTRSSFSSTLYACEGGMSEAQFRRHHGRIKQEAYAAKQAHPGRVLPYRVDHFQHKAPTGTVRGLAFDAIVLSALRCGLVDPDPYRLTTKQTSRP